LLSAVCLAGFPLVGIFGGLDYIAIPILLGGIFFLLMLACKNKQLQQEEKQNAQPKGDFLNPLPKSTAENSTVTLEPTPDESSNEKPKATAEDSTQSSEVSAEANPTPAIKENKDTEQ
jgi:cytoskeletal protein RodZ